MLEIQTDNLNSNRKNRQAGTIMTTGDKGDGIAEDADLYTGGHMS